ncbi:DUF4976 domain-containing protein [Labilibacter sediminis]|nr:DUF4976 domain-containing protein [Labilibacter sediminis]
MQKRLLNNTKTEIPKHLSSMTMISTLTISYTMNTTMLKQTVLIFTILISINIYTKASINSKRKPNIIFFLTDDQRWDAFGFMGNKYIQTPNCDQLANNGIIFNNTYHVVPICQPSRASFMLSQYVGTHQCGFDKPAIYSISEAEFAQSYPVKIREAGYFTGIVGKFGFPITKEKVRNSAEYTNAQDRDAKTQLWLKEECLPKEEYDVWYGFSGQGFYNVKGKHGTEYRGDQSIAFIREAAKQEKPFSLQVCFKAPHSPFQPAEEFLRLYDDVEIPRYPNDTNSANSLLPVVVRNKYRGNHGYSDKKYQAFIKKYYALITGVDHVVGRVMTELKAQGLDDNTIIVFTSDNGYFCGSKGLSGKDLLYEESAKAPLIIYDPRLPIKKRGTTIDAIISIIDVAPTLLNYAETDIPAEMQGKSLLPLIENPDQEIHEAVYGENNFANFAPLLTELDEREKASYSTVRSRFVRTPQYKYIQYHECTPMVEELWDITADPSELKNLADKVEYKHQLNKMRQLMDTFIHKNVK